MSGFTEGITDVGSSAYGNVGDTYIAFLQGRLAPQAEMTGDMVTTNPAVEIAESYDAALRDHQAMEQEEHVESGYEPYPAPDATSPDIG